MIELIDKNNFALLDFRKKIIFDDCKNFPSDTLVKNYSYHDLKNIVNNETFEDGWRFTNEKFYKTNWHHILVQKYNNEIVTFSGAILHGEYLKVGIFHYFLKQHRQNNLLRGSLFRENGFIDNHIKHTQNIKGVFFTVFEHNKQLSSYVKYLQTKRFMFEKHNMSLLNKFCSGGTIQYKGVEQSLFYLPINNCFSLDELKLFTND